MAFSRKLTTLLSDIDDTLIPWEHPHAKAYPAMSLALSQATNLPHQKIIEEIRAVNTKHDTIEYTALIQEMPSFQDFSAAEKKRLIKIAIESRQQAMKGLNHAFPGVNLMLDSLKSSGLKLIAISDAPKNLAYLRLKNAGLIDFFDLIIGLNSPSDHHFEPEFQMENKPFLVDTIMSPVKKPHTDLEKLLGKNIDEIAQSYFVLGNSGLTDRGLAENYGLLFYHSEWNISDNADHQILQQYAPENLLTHQPPNQNSGKSARISTTFEEIKVQSPLQVIVDLQERNLI